MVTQTNTQDTPPQGGQPPLIVNAQYIKDLSFENPAAPPQQAASQEAPEISVNIEAQANPLVDRSFEVCIRIQVTAQRKDKPVFLLDLTYAGVFTIGTEVPDEYVRPILMIECPRLLFPFARQVVSSLIQEGGYPTLLLNPVDFADLYQRQVAQEEQAQKDKTETADPLQ